jgi:hypothetical protein
MLDISFIVFKGVHQMKKTKKTTYSVGIFSAFFLRSRDIHITYRVLQTMQMKLILLCVWAERAVLGSAKIALEFKYEV